MAVPNEAFRAGDVYIDYPQEQVMFHYVHETGVVFRRFYGEEQETEVARTSNLYAEAQRIGVETTAEFYENRGKLN